MQRNLLSNSIAVAALVTLSTAGSTQADVLHYYTIYPGVGTIMQYRTLPAVTTTTTTITEATLKQPDPAGRLRSMMDQINLGESTGMLNAAESASLRAEYGRLDALIRASLAGGLTKGENDNLEKQLTIFNQQISNSMQ